MHFVMIIPDPFVKLSNLWTWLVCVTDWIHIMDVNAISFYKKRRDIIV